MNKTNKINNFTDKCSRCYFHKEWCLCCEKNKISNKVKVVITMNSSEFFKLSNSGKLLMNVLENCELRIRGLKDNPLDFSNYKEEYSDSKNYLLFPSYESTEITKIRFPKNKHLTLFVPDGNWSQGAKIAKKIYESHKVTTIKLPQIYNSTYKLRNNPNKDRISTFEATIETLKFMEEKNFSTQKAFSMFNKMVSQVLKLRGKESGAKRGT